MLQYTTVELFLSNYLSIFQPLYTILLLAIFFVL